MLRHTIAAALMLFIWSTGHAQTPAYPVQPVKLVVGFAAGGPTDIVARMFGEHAARGFGQPVLVENRPGANAILAADAVAAARPDGHTLLIGATNHAMTPALYADRIKFDAVKSFRPVCILAASPTVLVTGPRMRAATLAEFTGLLRAKPGAYTYASTGVGSSVHLATEMFGKLTGTTMIHVPYKGAAPAAADLLGGQVDFYFATAGSVLPHIKSGKLTALAVTGAQRPAMLPAVPTFEEAGVKGFALDAWYGVLAPAGIPAPVAAALEKTARDFVQAPAIRERLLAAGLEAQTTCGDAFAAQLTREVGLYTQVVRDLKLKLE